MKASTARIKAVARIGRRDDDAREIALRRAIHLVQIGLFRLGGDTGGRTAALHFDENYRRFDHAGHADGFGHQREAAAGGGAHGARAGVSGADRHVGHGQFVFHLLDDDAAALGMIGHPGENAGRRRHGIGGIEAAAGRDRADRERLVAGEVRPALAENFHL